MEINWKSYLDYNFPYIGRVYLNDSDLESVNNKLQERNDSLTIDGEKYETTFYDLLVRVIHAKIGTDREKEVSLKILSFLNEQIEYYFKLVKEDSELILQLKKQLDNLFRVNGDKYLDKVGEIASTVFLIKKYNASNLISLEYKFEKDIKDKNKSRDVDLVFKENSITDLILIDVFNINLDYRKIENEKGLLKLLNHRISKKIKEKGFDSDFIKKNFKDALIQPFIWIYDADTILRYKNFFKNLSIEKTLPILCIRQRSDEKGRLYFDCVEMTEFK